MSVKIRLTRIGRHEDPIYRIVVADSHYARDGRCIEQIGHYNPKLGLEAITIKEDRALYWLGKGAQPSDTVRSMLSSKGIIAKHAAAKAPKAKKVAKVEKTETPAVEKKPAAKKPAAKATTAKATAAKKPATKKAPAKKEAE